MPVVSLAVALPSTAASPAALLRLEGDCGLVSPSHRRFTLTAPQAAIPVATIVRVAGSGGLVGTDIGRGHTVTGVTAQVLTTGRTVTFTLTSPISAGNTAEFAVNVSADAGRLDGSVTLPAGQNPGAGAKTTGWIEWTSNLCSDG